MSIREKIKARKSAVVTEQVEGFGDVPILKLDVGGMIELGKLPTDQQNCAMVAMCVMDEDGIPVFTDAQDVSTHEYAFFQQLLKACYRVNGIQNKIDAASGN